MAWKEVFVTMELCNFVLLTHQFIHPLWRTTLFQCLERFISLLPPPRANLHCSHKKELQKISIHRTFFNYTKCTMS